MAEFNYNNRRFVGVENYDDGDLTSEVLFKYSQEGTEIRGTFSGGRVEQGKLVAELMPGGKLDMVWQYLNVDGEFVSGCCRSTPTVLPDGRYRLDEDWIVTGGPNQGLTGVSAIEEIRDEEKKL